MDVRAYFFFPYVHTSFYLILLFLPLYTSFPAYFFFILLSSHLLSLLLSALSYRSHILSHILSLFVLLCVLLSMFYLLRCSSLLFTTLSSLYCICHCYSLPYSPLRFLSFSSLSLKTTLHFSVNPLYYLVSVA